MAIFADLPPIDAVLNGSHEDAANLVHAWLFNAGSGSDFTDYVENETGTTTNGHWENGGGYHFASNAYGVLNDFTTVAAPYTVVVGVTVDGTAGGWRPFLAKDRLLAYSGGSLAVYALTCDKYYMDGAESNSAPTCSSDTPHVVGFHVHSGDLYDDWRVNIDQWAQYCGGIYAFIYVYSGEVDADLQARLAADPYAMFAAEEGPRVDAGPDQSVYQTLATPVTLAGSATDDGSPPALTYLWTVVSGPGSPPDVTFDDDTDPTTDVMFGAFGVYVLRLTADDGEATGYDDVEIAANEPTAGRISQVVLESLSSWSPPPGRISQVVLESLSGEQIAAWISQVVVETLSNVRRGLRIRIDRVDHLVDLNQTKAVVIDLIQNNRSRMRFTCRSGYTPSRFSDVVVYAKDGETPIFGGLILQRSFAGLVAGSVPAEMTCECVDYSAYLDWCCVSLTFATDPTLQTVLEALVAALPTSYGITLDGTDYGGSPPLTAFSWETKRASDALRELCDRLGLVYVVSPTKVLSLFTPGTLSAPATITDAAPNCMELTWDDSPEAAITTVKLLCGTGVESYTQHWIANGSDDSWVADLPAAWPGGYFVCTMVSPGSPAVITYATVDDVGATGGWLWWDWETHTLSIHNYELTLPVPAGTTMAFSYPAQYPFEVSATVGGSPPPPEIQEIQTRPDVFDVAQGQEIVDGLLAQLGGNPRTVTFTSYVDGWTPGQAVPVDLAGRATGTFVATAVTIVLQTPEFWHYTVTAVELDVFKGTYLDQWRSIVKR